MGKLTLRTFLLEQIKGGVFSVVALGVLRLGNFLVFKFEHATPGGDSPGYALSKTAIDYGSVIFVCGPYFAFGFQSTWDSWNLRKKESEVKHDQHAHANAQKLGTQVQPASTARARGKRRHRNRR